MSKRAYRYRFYPAPEQADLLPRTFGCTRFVYNTVLRYRTDAYRGKGDSTGYREANAKLTELKRSEECAWLSEVSCVPLQQCLRHQQRAFQNFFAGRAGYPVFKSKHRRQSIEFTRRGFTWRDGQITLAKCSSPLAIRWSQPLPGEPSTLTVSMDTAGRYFVSCLCEFEAQPLPVTAKCVGIDMGLSHLAITSDGETIANPRPTAQYASKLASAPGFGCTP